MHALTLVVPASAISFFLWKGRRDTVYILALPLLIAYGRSIFLDIYSLQLTLGGGIAINQEDVLLISLLVVFAYVRAVRPISGDTPLTLQLYLCVGLLILLCAKALAAGFPNWSDLASPGQLYLAAKAGAAARVWFYLPLSIVLWHAVLRRFSSQEILHLLRILTWVTCVCSVVYLADLAGVRTYTRIWEPYMIAQGSAGARVFRDYLFIPGSLNIALGFSLAHVAYGKQRATYVPVALLLTACALFSFTRATAAIAIVLWFVAALWWAVVIPRHGRAARRPSAIGPARAFVAVCVFAAASAAVVLRWSSLQVWWAYLVERLNHPGGVARGDPNTVLRMNLYPLAADVISHQGFLLGTLMTSTVAARGVYFLDSYWSAVIVSVGWLGLVVVGGLVVIPLVEATARALRSASGPPVLSLGILLGLLMTVSLSFTGGAWAAAAVTGAFLLAAPDVRFRGTSRTSSAADPRAIEDL